MKNNLIEHSNPHSVLDSVLEAIVELTKKDPVEEGAIFYHPDLAKLYLSQSIKDAILVKLVEDGYLIRVTKEEYSTGVVLDSSLVTRYSVSFKGYILIKEGGYTRKIRKETTRLNLQSVQTWAIVLGTVAAGFPYIWKGLKLMMHFLDYLCCCCCYCQ